MTLTEGRTALERPGSARRAAIGMAGSSAIIVVLGGLCLAPAARTLGGRGTFEYSPEFDFWALGLLVLMFVSVVGLPATSFTVGRLIDRRLAGAGSRTSIQRFAVTGAFCGLLLAMVLTMSEVVSTGQFDVKFALTVAFLYVVLFAVAGAGGRLLGVLAFRDIRWRITVWAVYAVLMVPVVIMVARTVQHSRWFH